MSVERKSPRNEEKYSLSEVVGYTIEVLRFYTFLWANRGIIFFVTLSPVCHIITESKGDFRL